jgi:hypothetical protein
MAKRWLEQIEIATPCEARWDEMSGDEQVRHCGQCRRSVFNLSAMTRKEAESFIDATEESVCLRLYRREDGTVITSDCPIGLAERARAASQVIVRAAIFAVLFLTAWMAAAMGRPRATAEFSLGSAATSGSRKLTVMGTFGRNM